MIKVKNSLLAVVAALSLSIDTGSACTRVVYQGADDSFYTARSLDWQSNLYSDLWIFPRGMQRDGGIDSKSLKWVSKYGSVVTSAFDAGSCDGMNEKGLAVNLLYLIESNFGKPNGKPTISIGAWPQYILDNFATVSEAVERLSKEPFQIVAPPLPDGKASGLHLSISDATGDSAIFEYIDGKLIIHHSKDYKVMTNSPTFDKQLALNVYWKEIGGLAMLPGTARASDRFVRASYYIENVPKFKDEKKAVGAVFSIIREVSVPIGISDPQKPNIATTYWRTVSDHKHLKYYYESTMAPNIFWVDMKKIDFDNLKSAKKLELEGDPVYAGDVSEKFTEAKPFKWLAPAKDTK